MKGERKGETERERENDHSACEVLSGITGSPGLPFKKASLPAALACQPRTLRFSTQFNVL